MRDQTIRFYLLKLELYPDEFSVGELDELTIALRRREGR